MQAIVMTFDHLAIGSLGCYGHQLIRTPNFDELAAGSVVFDQCFGAVQEQDAFAGLATLMDSVRASGGRAEVHRCRAETADSTELTSELTAWREAPSGQTPALLWLRCSAIESPWSAPAHLIVASWRESYPLSEIPLALSECGIGLDNSGASLEDGLAAAWPHLLSRGVLSRDRIALTPLIGRLRRCVYAAAVMALDTWLGGVLKTLSACDGPDSMLIITAGAGDLAGPHDGISAGCPPVVDPFVHVPLLIRTGSSPDGTRRGGLVSTTDLAPTLAEWLGVPFQFAERPSSRNLWPLLRDDSHSVREELLIGSHAVGWNLRMSDFACVCEPADGASHSSSVVDTDRARLFVKPDDAWDTLDVAQQYQTITADRTRRIRELVRSKAEPADDA